jgi:hypothetical protein
MVAAFRAKLVNFPPTPAQAANTSMAHDLAAAKAPIGAPNSGMAWTDQRAIPQNDRRGGGRRNVESRNMDGDLGGFSDEFDLAKTQETAGGDGGGIDRLTINESPIRGLAVADYERVTDDFDLAMDV